MSDEPGAGGCAEKQDSLMAEHKQQYKCRFERKLYEFRRFTL